VFWTVAKQLCDTKWPLLQTFVSSWEPRQTRPSLWPSLRLSLATIRLCRDSNPSWTSMIARCSPCTVSSRTSLGEWLTFSNNYENFSVFYFSYSGYIMHEHVRSCENLLHILMQYNWNKKGLGLQNRNFLTEFLRFLFSGLHCEVHKNWKYEWRMSRSFALHRVLTIGWACSSVGWRK
jgi:hypothetical protein